MVSASDRAGVAFCLTGGNVHDSIGGRLLISLFPQVEGKRYLAMDKAYEGDKMRRIAEQRGFTVVVPPKSNRKNPWDYDKEIYRGRNAVERLFAKIKEFRGVATRYCKLDTTFRAFINFAMIVMALV